METALPLARTEPCGVERLNRVLVTTEIICSSGAEEV
jgi:hypothetical protein